MRCFRHSRSLNVTQRPSYTQRLYTEWEWGSIVRYLKELLRKKVAGASISQV